MTDVSVVIPAYNAEKYIKCCIDSVLRHTGDELEIIVVDDGSTDETASLAEKCGARVIKKQNGGAASARNVGLRAATGEYIMFLDSDDYLAENYLGLMLGAARETGADITRSALLSVNNDGSETPWEVEFPNRQLFKKPEFAEALYPKMLSGIKLNSIVRTLYRREVVENLSFDETLRTCEDLAFQVQAITRAQSFIYLSDALYCYRQTNQGLTGNALSVMTKYKCNFIVGAQMRGRLKAWGMDSIKYRIMCSLRPIAITLSKIKRRCKP